jgi:hypothetical protein
VVLRNSHILVLVRGCDGFCEIVNFTVEEF